MGQTIVKLEHEGQDYYLLWSSVVDAPVTYGLSLEELEDYLREEEGARYMRNEHPRRISGYISGRDFIRHQIHQERACALPEDDPGGWWTVEEVIQKYIVERPEGDDDEDEDEEG